MDSSPTRRMSLKWGVVTVAAILCLLAWVAMGIGLAIGVEFTPKLILVTAAALSTELLMWLLAAALGHGVLKSRRQLWLKLVESVCQRPER